MCLGLLLLSSLTMAASVTYADKEVEGSVDNVPLGVTPQYSDPYGVRQFAVGNDAHIYPAAQSPYLEHMTNGHAAQIRREPHASLLGQDAEAVARPPNQGYGYGQPQQRSQQGYRPPPQQQQQWVPPPQNVRADGTLGPGGYGQYPRPQQPGPSNRREAEIETRKFDELVLRAEAKDGFPDTIHTTMEPEEDDSVEEAKERDFVWDGVWVVVIIGLCAIGYSWKMNDDAAKMEAKIEALNAQRGAAAPSAGAAHEEPH